MWETIIESIVSFPKSSVFDHDTSTQGLHVGTSDKLKKGDAVLVDIGAVNNLLGSQWVERMDCLNHQVGKPKSTRAPLGCTVTLGGVGKNTPERSLSVQVPTIVNGDSSIFTGTIAEGSDSQALSGMKTLRDNCSMLAFENDRLIMPQAGQHVQIVRLPGTQVFQHERAPGGFLVLPCSPGTSASV